MRWPKAPTRAEQRARDELASAEPAIVAKDTQENEDRIGLNKATRREVQRGLTRLGFNTKASGKFDEATRAVIRRWQAARGYPETGFLDTVQHTALRAEIASAAQASASGTDKPEDARRSGGGSSRPHRGSGGPGGLIGGVVGGMFR